MLDRFKLFQELARVQSQILTISNEHFNHLELLWKQIAADEALAGKITAKKWSLLVPAWKGEIGQVFKVVKQPHPYQVLAVDGSQIYYDKHQGPACSLINIGGIRLQYGLEQSNVELYSYPEIIVAGESEIDSIGTEYINLYREQCELSEAVKKSYQCIQQSGDPFLCMLDGTLIFFQVENEIGRDTDNFFNNYIQQLQLFYEYKILHVAYMSFPRTKDLVNIIRLYVVDFQEKKLSESDPLSKFLDMDVVNLFLPEGCRTIVFESKAPITYAYPQHLKPYFCYLNVGLEIIRLEFPAWIAQDHALVEQICAIAFDQAQKGSGYPVALFEAHEQAVIKSVDREFFYEMIKQVYAKNNQNYKISLKSSKKIQPPV